MIRFCIALLALWAGCLSTSPERAFYLLRADLDPALAPADVDTQTGLGLVSVAPYLDRAGIMVQLDDNQVREARYHLWAEPLDRGIRQYLNDRIARELGRALSADAADTGGWRYRVDVSIEEFHGTLAGEARLVARWSLRDLREDRLIVGERFVRSRRQDDDGYPGLVKAQIALLDQLAASIAKALRSAYSA